MPEPLQLPNAGGQDPIEYAGKALSVINLLQNLNDNRTIRDQQEELRQQQLEDRKQKAETINKIHGVFANAKPDTKDEELDRQLWAIDPAVAKEWGQHRKGLQDSANSMSAEKRLQAAADTAQELKDREDFNAQLVNLKSIAPQDAVSLFPGIVQIGRDKGFLPMDYGEVTPANIGDALNFHLGNTAAGTAALRAQQKALEDAAKATREVAQEGRAVSGEARAATAATAAGVKATTEQEDAAKTALAQALGATRGNAAEYAAAWEAADPKVRAAFPRLGSNQAWDRADRFAKVAAPEKAAPAEMQIYEAIRLPALTVELGHEPTATEKNADFLSWNSKIHPQAVSEFMQKVAAHDADPALVKKYGSGINGLIAREQANRIAEANVKGENTFDRNNPSIPQTEVDYWVNRIATDPSPAVMRLIGNLGKNAEHQINAALAKNGVDIDTISESNRTLAQTAKKILPEFEKATTAINTPSMQAKLGPVLGRWNEFLAGTVGAGDPELAALRSQISLLKTGVMRAHFGARGGQGILDRFDSLANTGKMDAATLTAALNGMRDFLKDVYVDPRYGGSKDAATTTKSAAPVVKDVTADELKALLRGGK